MLNLDFIARTTDALACCLDEVYGDEAVHCGVVVGYDGSSERVKQRFILGT